MAHTGESAELTDAQFFLLAELGDPLAEFFLPKLGFTDSVLVTAPPTTNSGSGERNLRRGRLHDGLTDTTCQAPVNTLGQFFFKGTILK